MSYNRYYDRTKYIESLREKSMTLGEEFNYLYPYSNKCYTVRLIKVTKCGYNLLNLHLNKCILKNHLYPNKKAVEAFERKHNIVLDMDTMPIPFLLPFYTLRRLVKLDNSTFPF